MRRRLKVTEHQSQVALFQYIELVPEIAKVTFAIPSGGLRNKIVAKKLKDEGCRAGVPDIFIGIARGNYHSMFIELKNESGKGVVSPLQKEMIKALRKEGHYVVVANGYKEAVKEINYYLGLKKACN